MSCTWTDEKLYKLVQLYSKFSNLWDREHPLHDDLRGRHTSYNEILTSLSMPTYVSVRDVICKLKELRTIYVSELRKIHVASKNGSVRRPNYTWFRIMHEFLYDHLDADEKLADLSSSKDCTASSKGALNMPRTMNCRSDSNSSFPSDSDVSFDQGTGTSANEICPRSKQPKRSQAYFVRSPTILRSTKMNTKYEFPSKPRASSMPGKQLPHQEGNSYVRSDQETQLDVKMTASDVSIKYLRTENVNGDEKSYKKNLKGRMCSTDKPLGFKNIKVIISKSGYAVPESSKTNEVEDKDTEFWEMMSMLDLGVPCPSNKLESTHPLKPSCCGVSSIDSLSHRDFLPPLTSSPACKPGGGGSNGKNRVEDIMGTEGRLEVLSSCRSKGTKGSDLGCRKTTKVVCLGDETLFDDSLLELLQDLSIKICPVDGSCTSGDCPGKPPDNLIEGFLTCKTCSSATRPVKEYQMEAGGSTIINDVDSTLQNGGTEAETNEVESGLNLKTEKSEHDNSISSNSIRREQQNYDVKAVLASAGVRSSSKRDAILNDAKRELWEAGKLYNRGKYITNDIVSPGSKNEQSVDFDSFGARIASSLKMMGKQQALKLKQMIAETLQGERTNKYF